MGALLRREGLYSSLLTNWRRQREAGALREMRGRRRGPRPVDPRMKQLEAENRRLQRKLQRAETSHHAPKKSCRDPGDPPDTPRRRRDRLMRAIEAVTTPGETAALCQSVGVSRASLYRRRRPAPRSTPPRPRAPSSRALGATERQAVLDVLHSERFIDQSPADVHATLLEEQRYLCAPRTMYRVLAAAKEVHERRAQARHPVYTAPELVATRPNQVWSWGHHQTQGPDPVPLLLAVRHPRPLQPLRGGLDGRAPRECAPGGAPDCGNLPEAGHRPAPTHDSRGPRRAHAEQARRAALLGPGYQRQSFAAPREQRQSVLRSAVPDREVPAGSFLAGSARSHTRATSAAICSRGTTTRTITAA